MTRREAAELIFPDSKGRVAVNRLARWINADPELWRELRRKGYRKHMRTFTPPVLRVLQTFLGF